jgi:UDP-3-O-[3-hydroxymyristoyl] glucosamine N-acyltransferase
VLVRELAAALGAAFEGDGERHITAAAAIEDAGPEHLSFAASPKACALAERSSAGCLIVPPDFPSSASHTLIRARNPRAVFAQAVRALHPPRLDTPGVHPTAVLAPSALIDPSAEIAANVSIGERSTVGPRTVISAGCAIAADVTIGSDCVLYPRVVIYDRVSIGNRTILHSGVVIGADGFGFALAGNRYEKFPQVGRVEIGDDVEIGANSCVDRAALGVTSIGDGTKLDNMVHIGHNCRVGRHVVIAAQTGFSGGCVIDDYAVIGGQVGLGDKVHIESRAVLGSKCGVLPSKTIRTGQVMWGIPARPLKQHLEQLAQLGRLGELREAVEDLRRRLEAIETGDHGP